VVLISATRQTKLREPAQRAHRPRQAFNIPTGDRDKIGRRESEEREARERGEPERETRHNRRERRSKGKKKKTKKKRRPKTFAASGRMRADTRKIVRITP
jgi:hypothetical protein